MQEMVAKPVTGHSVFSRALLAPGDVGIGTHSARGRHSTCAMAPKPYLITYRVPWKGTVPQRVRIPPGKLSLQPVAIGGG